uniref:Uncharacterized protein n=1 Tax=viral metagenome TaxID=1070528 RepID=A0A6C0D1U2_9ZZZZ
MNYLDSIETNHCFVSFSPANNIFYISLWNGVLRDGKIDDIDIDFFESPSCSILNNTLVLHNKNISLSITQLQHLRILFPEN